MKAFRRKLLMQSADRERVLVEVCQRVMHQWGATAPVTEEAIFSTIYSERQRLRSGRSGKAQRKLLSHYDQLYNQAQHQSAQAQRSTLQEIVQSFAQEVVGHFDPKVYAVATQVVPKALNVLLSTATPLRLMEIAGGDGALEDQFKLTGDVEGMKRAAKQGTVILVPTHVSNLDSIMIGYGLHSMGLPPFTYGAGLNLFANKVVGYFMHNLGAYKVDRSKGQVALYKDVLKTYAGYTIELGYHNLFFPGGTRSRGGHVEQRLKMGLLGTGLDAYINNLINGKSKPDIFVVPCTLNFQLVLEAETLIEDYLKDKGKSRYIIDDDEFSKPERLFAFFRKLFAVKSTIHMVLSPPRDVFGNRVDKKGRSLDPRGRVIDRKSYVMDDGLPVHDTVRDREYVKLLADAIVSDFKTDSVMLSTHLLCYVVFCMMREQNPDMDLFQILRTGGRQESFAMSEVYQKLGHLLEGLVKRAEEGEFRIDDTLSTGDAMAVAAEALAHLGVYHTREPMQRRGDRLFPLERDLIFYYHNRIDSLLG